MALVTIRNVQNDPAAASYDPADSSRLYAEDWNALKKALLDGTQGIRTKDLKTTSLTIGITEGSTLQVDTPEFDTADGVTVKGSVKLRKIVLLTQDLVTTGTLDGLDILTHDHSTSSGTLNLPMTSINGATQLAFAHSHSNDGSPQIYWPSIELNTVDSMDYIDPNFIGSEPDKIVRGSYATEQADRVKKFYGIEEVYTGDADYSPADAPSIGMFVNLHSCGMLNPNAPDDDLFGSRRGYGLQGDVNRASASFQTAPFATESTFDMRPWAASYNELDTADDPMATANAAVDLTSTPESPSGLPNGFTYYGLSTGVNSQFPRFRGQVCLPNGSYDIRVRLVFSDTDGLSNGVDDFAETYFGLIPLNTTISTGVESEGNLTHDLLGSFMNDNTLTWSNETASIFASHTISNPITESILSFEVGFGNISTVSATAALYGLHIMFKNTLLES